jgi:hypothetical protein
MNAPKRPWDRLSERPGAPDESLDRRGGPDDRARPPRELLANLRLRLSQLADNHPSAPGYRRPPGQPTGDDADAAAGHDGQAGEGDGGPVGVLGDQKRGSDAGSESPAGRETGSADRDRPADAVRTAAAAIAAGLGVLATMELPPGGRPAGDPYRPWFMAGEPGSPWWSGKLY